MPQRLGVVLFALLVAGCAYLGAGTSPEPSPESTSRTAAPTLLATDLAPTASTSTDSTTPPTARPIPSASPIPTASPNAATATPSPFPSLPPEHAKGLAASNRFWNDFYDTCWFGAFSIVSSLAEITAQSDVVIRGHLEDLYIGDSSRWGAFTYARVSISEMLKGELQVSGRGTLDIHVHPDAPLAELRSRIPSHDNLWFVKTSEDFPGTYYPTDYPQVSILRDIGGNVRVIRPDEIARAYSVDHYPVPLEETRFEELIQKVRDLRSGSGVVELFARRSSVEPRSATRWAAC